MSEERGAIGNANPGEAGFLLPGERVDDLQLAWLRIIQSPKAFRFSMDSVLLSDFARVRPWMRICDLGTGTGILPLLLYGRAEGILCDAVEIQPDIADRARRTMALNGLANAITIHCGDLRRVRDFLPHAAYQMVICNPPYNPAQASLPCSDPGLRAARQEDLCALEDIAAAASWLLQNRARFVLMLPAARLAGAVEILRQYRLEPKRLRFVHETLRRPARLALIEAMLDTRAGLIVEPPLIIRNADGGDTEEVKRIYHMPDESAKG